jgi:hypothetical protein
VAEPEPPDAPPEPAVADEPVAEAAEAEPAAAAPGNGEPEAAAGGSGSEVDARLIALNMALNGQPREEADRYLAENFDIADRASLLDEVYSAVEG